MVARMRSTGSCGSSLQVPNSMNEKCLTVPQHHGFSINIDNSERTTCTGGVGSNVVITGAGAGAGIGVDSTELPQWSPQDDSNFPVKFVFTAKKRKSNLRTLLAVTFMVVCGYTYHTLNTSLKVIEQESQTALRMRNQLNIKMRSTEKDVRMLSREIQTAQQLRRKEEAEAKLIEARLIKIAGQDLEFAKHNLGKMQNIYDDTHERMLKLRRSVQRYSSDTASQKYGPTIHHVQVVLDFPDTLVGPDSFTVQMASLNIMPHSVHTFLDMASNGLWDGCSFIMNAMHMLKAAPLPYHQHGPTALELGNAFTDAGLNGPTFKEHSDYFPHKMYTLGFAGGNSPSFYINTDDNTKIHQGESAFGQVTEGFNTIDRLLNYPTQNGLWFKERIGIKSVRVL